MESCPDGFRCGHCVANDKAKREAARAQVAQRIDLGEQAVAGAGLGMLTGVVSQTYPVVGLAQARTFTREEVLTTLRALKADTGVVAGKEALDRAVRVFERIE